MHALTGEVPWRQRIRQILSQRQRGVISREDLTSSAVLVPIYEKAGECYIVLTKRTQQVEHHKGQVSFPGGAYDAGDGDLRATALRETYEEIGVCAEDVEILGNLDDQATTTSNFAITPFVGAILYPYEFKINRREVEALIEASVADLLDQASYSTRTLFEGRLYPVASYRYRGHQVTGITAIILKQLLDLVFR